MKLLDFKSVLQQIDQIQFILPNGSFVPSHFHVTEAGAITKHFMDCGGTERIERRANFQLWVENDIDHRLSPSKLLSIIAMSEEKLGLGNWDIEVEYQLETIGKFNLDYDGNNFLLINALTDCLAKDKCGIPTEKPRIRLSNLGANSCDPKSGCC